MSDFAEATDILYRSVVMEPEQWSDVSFADWASALSDGGPPSREESRQIRRALRIAVKLQAFWGSASQAQLAERDWRARVDLAVGVPAWRPPLALAELSFDRHPTNEAFYAVAERFPVVHNQPFLGGASFEEWLSRPDSAESAL